jgi:hypothetical protein
MGSVQDHSHRRNIRVDTHARQQKVEMTRNWIIEKGYKIRGAAVERVLFPESLVPTRVSKHCLLHLSYADVLF